jgi:hypothetical protein
MSVVKSVFFYHRYYRDKARIHSRHKKYLGHVACHASSGRRFGLQQRSSTQCLSPTVLLEDERKCDLRQCGSRCICFDGDEGQGDHPTAPSSGIPVFSGPSQAHQRMNEAYVDGGNEGTLQALR